MVPENDYTSVAVMVWGFVSASGHCVLLFLDETLNGTTYARYLQNYFDAESHIVDDRASSHNRKKENEVREVIEIFRFNMHQIPVRSPEFNIIETVWSAVKARVYKDNQSYTSVSSLKTAIVDAWKAVTSDKAYLRSLLNHLYDALPRIIQARGGRID